MTMRLGMHPSWGYTWTVEEKITTPRRRDADEGYRYRYVCTCGHKGPWRINPNDADGDNHLHYAHGEGD